MASGCLCLLTWNPPDTYAAWIFRADCLWYMLGEMLVCPECGTSESGQSTCSVDGSPLVDSRQDDLIGRTRGG